MFSNFNDFNYSEIIIFDKQTKIDNNQININWNENKFNNLIKNLINKKFRSFEKKYKITKHNDLILVNNLSDDNLNLNTLSYISHNNIINNNYNIIIIKYNKENLPPYQFPSTDIIHDKYYLNKIIFKITNRIYVNFEIMKKYGTNDIFRRVYINLNNDNKSKNKLDNKNINELIYKCITDYFN
jgi:hypothetical protein